MNRLPGSKSPAPLKEVSENREMTPDRNWRESFSGQRFARLIEPGDLLLFLYLLVFARQYFWILDNNFLAWTLSLPLATLVWYVYVSTKQFPAERSGWTFWLVVGLPLLLVYLLRAPFPDRSFDVINYHLLHSERSLRGALFSPADYFPSGAPFNPIADTLTGLSRLSLGFRLGTIINLLALLWTGQIVDRILRPVLSNRWLRSSCVLLILLTEHLLFEISTYMVDLLTLPLLAQATLLTLKADEAPNRKLNFLHIAGLLGASMAFKFTSLAVAVPILAICVYKILIGRERFSPKNVIVTGTLMLSAFAAPLLPFAIYIYRLTGNPVFPVANGFFKSPFWPTHGGWDNRWGPQTPWETILWPILIWFKPERHSELAVYSGRLSLGVIVALIGLVLLRRNKQVRTLCGILVISSLLWSITALGYSRYGLYEDLFAGVVIVFVGASFATLQKFSWRTLAASILLILLAVQSFFALSFNRRKEWGERTNVIADPDIWVEEAKLSLRDRSIGYYLTDQERARIAGVQMWLETSPKSTGFEVMLNPVAPIVAVRQPEYFLTRNARREFIRKVGASNGQGMYSLSLNADLENAKRAITERGLQVANVTPFDLPFFSPRGRIGMMLIEVQLPQTPEGRQEFENSWLKGAFADSDYREEIVAFNPPSVLRPGEKIEIRTKVRNLGSATWPSVGTKDFRYQINMGNRWVKNGVMSEDNRAVMKTDLAPGNETEINLTVNAPSTPGDYILKIDMVHEGVTWFEEKGGRPLLLPVRVQP